MLEKVLQARREASDFCDDLIRAGRDGSVIEWKRWTSALDVRDRLAKRGYALLEPARRRFHAASFESLGREREVREIMET